jgi:hypothetical protein
MTCILLCIIDAYDEHEMQKGKEQSSMEESVILVRTKFLYVDAKIL